MQSYSPKQQLHHELSRFIIIGVIATLADFLIYSFGHQYLPYAVAKTFSFILGSCLAYFLNQRFTFKQENHQKKQVIRFSVLYVITMCVNVSMNSLSIAVLTKWIVFPWLSHSAMLAIAFVFATGISTILNFIGQKFWVFVNVKQTSRFV